MEGDMRQRSGNKSILTTNKRKDNEDIRTGLGEDAIAKALIDNLHFLQAELLPSEATRNDWHMALAYTVRDRMWLVRRGRNPKAD